MKAPALGSAAPGYERSAQTRREQEICLARAWLDQVLAVCCAAVLLLLFWLAVDVHVLGVARGLSAMMLIIDDDDLERGDAKYYNYG